MPTLLFVMCHVAGLSVPRMSETQYNDAISFSVRASQVNSQVQKT